MVSDEGEINVDLMIQTRIRTHGPSTLVRDSSREYIKDLLDQSQHKRLSKKHITLRFPDGTFLYNFGTTAITGEDLEAYGFSVCGDKSSRLSLRYRFELYTLLRGYVKGSKFKCRFECPDSIASVGEHIYVSVEGNIGVGKTTLCSQLNEHLRQKILGAVDSEDPSDKKHIGDRVEYIEEKVHIDWLTSFLENKQEMATLFQFERLFSTINSVQAMGSAMKAHAEHGTRLHCVGDRLPLGNVAFAAMHYANGNITHDKFKLYGLTLANGGPYVYPDIVFLHCPIHIVQGRIAQRGRRGETTAYSREYLEMLDETNLFVMLYMWYTGVVNVSFLDWNTYQTPDAIIGAIEDDRHWKATKGVTMEEKKLFKTVRNAIRDNLLTMSYEKMKQLVSMLAWRDGCRGGEPPDDIEKEVYMPFDEIVAYLEAHDSFI